MRYLQSQRNKLKEHFRNHIYYKLCRQIHNVFQQHCPSIILSTDELFADAAKTLDILLTEGDFDAERCMDLWSETLADYREKDGINVDMTTTQAEVAMLFYAVMFGLQSVNHSHYRGKLQRALHTSIHQMWNKKGAKNCDAVEREMSQAVDSFTDAMLGWMREYFVTSVSITDEIKSLLQTKKPQPTKNKSKAKEIIYYTLPYNCKDETTRINRVNIVMRKMQDWAWIEEPQHAEDFDNLFDGEPRNCNIKWIGKPLAILTELMKRLLEQPYMSKVTGLTASSIVKNQFGKNRSSNAERLDAKVQERINMIVYILDYNKPLPLQPKAKGEGPDISDLALQAAFAQELHITKDLNHRYA